MRAWSTLNGGFDLSYTIVSQCENNAACRKLLLAQRHSGCMFGDILSLLQDIPSNMVQNGRLDFERAKPAVMTAIAAAQAKCYAHSCQCSTQEVADLDVSGSPCPPWSKAARHRLRRHHPAVLPFLAFCALMRTKRVPLLVHENVEGFDLPLLEELLGDLYEVDVIHAKPSDLGFEFIRRPRVYMVMCLRGRLRFKVKPSVLYSAVCAHMRANARAHPDVLASLWIETDAYFPTLTLKQARFADTYAQMYTAKTGRDPASDPCGVFDLGQTPRRAKPVRGVLPTFRRSTRLWLPSKRRFWTQAEAAVAMGFPVLPQVADACGVQPMRMLAGLPMAYLGNAMHVASVGSVCLIALIATEPCAE